MTSEQITHHIVYVKNIPTILKVNHKMFFKISVHWQAVRGAAEARHGEALR